MNQDETNKFGFYMAVSAAVVTAVTFVIAVFTPPISGPFCRGNCVEYPYTDVLSRFPRDYIWMVPAILLTLIYLGLWAAVHRYAAAEKKIFSLVGLCLAAVTTAILSVDYFLQLSVIQPSLARGEFDGISLLTQYNPHGVFVVLEEIGYLLMSLSFLAVAPVFSNKNRLDRSIRWILVSGLVLTVGSLIVISVVYGINREYLFEVAAISINWIVLIVVSILLSRLFRRSLKTTSN